ncbi:Putative Zn-dependent protease, contains TPR repeats [Thalassococcus halodurans]|uniref:Putative Zn-dependent protease, contains TPR repeats n=1 Tax=Thalassococcus halodurans TaxID=373675 RepID=A0A1H5VT54_9RHOB|nr:M48 family metalloprotease [Thalassococcus halodurans]SEF90186.1 Putative Zn-dependent protease, contains TPR repeats [Thalassococcus halodurans]
MKWIRFLVMATAITLMAATPARAINLLRDADIEYALRQLSAPILRAAGLSPSRIRVLVVDDSSLNAFVADTQHILIHSGLILKLNTAEELQAVIAHEAAHIANGHLSRRVANMRNARTAAGLGLVLSGIAAAAGGAEAGIGVAAGTSSSALRNFLAHTRAEESAADQSSIRYLTSAGINPEGAVKVQEIFRGQEVLSENRQDPYMRTHPLSRDRLRALQGYVAAYGKEQKTDGTANYWYARTQGKLSAFLRNPNWTLRRADSSATQDIGFMRQAVAYHKQSNLKKAVASIDKALQLRPNDPFLLDLKGQILLEGRQANAAIAVYRQAAAKAPKEALILGGLGRALLAAGQPREALKALESARARDGQDARILRDLAVAYAQTKQPGLASVATAERYALQGRLKDAAIHAKRAEALVPRGSPPWQRAQDILAAAQAAR